MDHKSRLKLAELLLTQLNNSAIQQDVLEYIKTGTPPQNRTSWELLQNPPGLGMSALVTAACVLNQVPVGTSQAVTDWFELGGFRALEEPRNFSVGQLGVEDALRLAQLVRCLGGSSRVVP